MTEDASLDAVGDARYFGDVGVECEVTSGAVQKLLWLWG